MNLNQTDIESVVIYFSDGRRVEFADIMQVTISNSYDIGEKSDYTIELKKVTTCIEHTKRTSKRHKKNKR